MPAGAAITVTSEISHCESGEISDGGEGWIRTSVLIENGFTVRRL